MQLNKQILHLNADDRALIAVVQNGLPVVSRPYMDIAKQLNITEEVVMDGR